jgi:hypothetical protein
VHWIILAAIAVALLVAASRYPKFAFSTLAVLVAMSVIMYRLTTGEVERGAELIDIDDIELTNVSIDPGYGGSFNFFGRVVNNAPDAVLTEMTLTIAMLDCERPDQSEDRCPVIGEGTWRVPVRVPPSQARDFKRNISFDQAKPRGVVRWRYAAIETVASRQD